MPFNVNLFKRSKKLMKACRVNGSLAPTSGMQNKKLIFSNLKDRKKLSEIRNGSFSVKCLNCSFRRTFWTTNLDVERMLKHHFRRKDSPILEHMNSNVGHIVPERAIGLRIFKDSKSARLNERLNHRMNFILNVGNEC